MSRRRPAHPMATFTSPLRQGRPNVSVMTTPRQERPRRCSRSRPEGVSAEASGMRPVAARRVASSTRSATHIRSCVRRRRDARGASQRRDDRVDARRPDAGSRASPAPIVPPPHREPRGLPLSTRSSGVTAQSDVAIPRAHRAQRLGEHRGEIVVAQDLREATRPARSRYIALPGRRPSAATAAATSSSRITVSATATAVRSSSSFGQKLCAPSASRSSSPTPRQVAICTGRAEGARTSSPATGISLSAIPGEGRLRSADADHRTAAPRPHLGRRAPRGWDRSTPPGSTGRGSSTCGACDGVTWTPGAGGRAASTPLEPDPLSPSPRSHRVPRSAPGASLEVGSERLAGGMKTRRCGWSRRRRSSRIAVVIEAVDSVAQRLGGGLRGCVLRAEVRPHDVRHGSRSPRLNQASMRPDARMASIAWNVIGRPQPRSRSIRSASQ